jgi:citrate lyase subunit beta/citryl-CoA lyase
MTGLPPRSFLYVPGHAADKLKKVLERGAEAVLLDLEDAVPVAEKPTARAQVREWLEGQLPDQRVELWARINPGALREDDVRALAGLPALTGLALAKAESADDVRAVADQLASLGDQSTVLMPMIESAAAVLRAVDIARAPRVRQLQIGEVDLTGDVGITTGPDEVELVAIRTQVVLASRAAGILPPLGAVSRITADPEALAVSTRRLARLGFLGRACIHPAQIDTVHEVFTPSGREVEEARDVVRLLEATEASGAGVTLDDQGRLVDVAVLEAARRTLALAARAGVA